MSQEPEGQVEIKAVATATETHHPSTSAQPTATTQLSAATANKLFYMNRMDTADFTQYLFCKEAMPLWQDPSLSKRMMRRRHKKRARTPKLAPFPLHRNKKRKEEDVSSKKKKRRKFDKQKSIEDDYLDPAYLTYDWTSLGLGQTTGSAGWNRWLRHQLYKNPDISRVPQLDAIECLHRVKQLQLRTLAPDADSPLHQVLRNTSVQNDRSLFQQGEMDDLQDNDKGPGFKTCGRIYQAMVTQDVAMNDDTAARRYQFLTADAMRDRMRQLENEHVELQTKQDRIETTAARLGLSCQTQRALGHVCNDPSMDGNSDGYYRAGAMGFRKLLAENPDRTAFLSYHDAF